MLSIRELISSSEHTSMTSMTQIPTRSVSANNSPFEYRRGGARDNFQIGCECTGRLGRDLERLKQEVEAIKGFLGFGGREGSPRCL